jgi:alpha-L-fucosidase 2
MPSSWKDAAFKDLRPEGGFSISASRKNGKTQFVNIESLAGEPCTLKLIGWRV